MAQANIRLGMPPNEKGKGCRSNRFMGQRLGTHRTYTEFGLLDTLLEMPKRQVINKCRVQKSLVPGPENTIPRKFACKRISGGFPENWISGGFPTLLELVRVAHCSYLDDLNKQRGLLLNTHFPAGSLKFLVHVR